MARRALLVEDDASIATVITAALEAEAFDVDRCDSIAGRDRFLSGSGYDVMLTDVVLTDGDGIATLGEVHRAYPDMPVIMLTGWGTMMKDDGDTPTQVDAVLSKPPKINELFETIARVLEIRRNQRPPQEKAA